MTHAEADALITEAGLHILEMIPLATVPFSETHPLAPVWLLEPLERRLSGLPALAPHAQHVVYVCASAQARPSR